VPKTVLKLLAAGAIGFVSIIGGYGVLAVYGKGLPPDPWNAILIASIVIPIPIGLFIAWAVYRIIS
jgi:hypothetical protein